MRIVLFDQAHTGTEGKTGEDSLEPAKRLISRVLSNYGVCSRRIGKDVKADLVPVILELYRRRRESLKTGNKALSLMNSEDIASLCGITQKAVYNHINRLVELNIIRKSQQKLKHRLAWYYELNGNTLLEAFKTLNNAISGLLEANNKALASAQDIIRTGKK